MGLDVLHLPCRLHLGLGTNQVRDPTGPVLVLVVVRSDDSEDLADLAVGVGDQPELEVLAIAKRLLCRRGVVRDTENLSARLLELWSSITEPLAFERSARAVRDGVPPQDGPLASQVRIGEGLTVLVRYGKARDGVTDGEHDADSYLSCPPPGPTCTVMVQVHG